MRNLFLLVIFMLSLFACEDMQVMVMDTVEDAVVEEPVDAEIVEEPVSEEVEEGIPADFVGELGGEPGIEDVVYSTAEEAINSDRFKTITLILAKQYNDEHCDTEGVSDPPNVPNPENTTVSAWTYRFKTGEIAREFLSEAAAYYHLGEQWIVPEEIEPGIWHAIVQPRCYFEIVFSNQ